jgi:hypothetical protein
MEKKIDLRFNNNIPTWDSLKVGNSDFNESFPQIKIKMEVYDLDLNDMIYSCELSIKGRYYYSHGSQNFEFENINKIVIKDCDNDNKKLIYNELRNNKENIKKMFENNILSTWNSSLFDSLFS